MSRGVHYDEKKRARDSFSIHRATNMLTTWQCNTV